MESGRLDLESATEGVTAEVNGSKEQPALVVPTYKPLPDDDTNWHKNNPKISNVQAGMGKQNEDAPVDDGAQEKMLNDESKITPAKDLAEVKFIPENGDAKIDIETVKKTLSGMGKEELMKYANDPFWIRLRWFLFIGFWVLWVGMLAGAVSIIVMAPKCSAPPPKKWWEKSPIVQIEAQDIDGKNEMDMATLLESLHKQQIEVLSLSKFVDDRGHVKDFRDVQPRVGTIGQFDKLVKVAKARNQRVVLEIDPNHSSIDHPWFNSSVEREEPYTDYYVWADPKSGTSEPRKPPNNWLSVYGGSAWEWHPKRQQYYLHQFNKTQPDLNFNNPAVVAEFGEILSHWLKRGVSGFRLGNTQYLTEDPDLRDEKPGQNPANPDEYDYLIHVHTYDRPQNGKILRQWRDIVENRTSNDCLFALRDIIGTDVLAVYNENKTLIDLPQTMHLFEKANSEITAEEIRKGIEESTRPNMWPSWDLNGNERDLRKRMPSEIADSITLMTLLLPGTPILKINDTQLPKGIFGDIAKARTDQAFLYGETKLALINNTVFVYTRVKGGSPGYLVAYQSSEEPAVIDVSMLPSIPSEMVLFAHSPNYAQDSSTINEKLQSNHLPMSPKSTLVATFSPKKD